MGKSWSRKGNRSRKSIFYTGISTPKNFQQVSRFGSEDSLQKLMDIPSRLDGEQISSNTPIPYSTSLHFYVYATMFQPRIVAPWSSL